MELSDKKSSPNSGLPQRLPGLPVSCIIRLVLPYRTDTGASGLTQPVAPQPGPRGIPMGGKNHQQSDFCLVGINLFHLSVNKVFLIVMAFFEMHIKSDELDCIPDVTKCRERNGQISNKNLFKSVHYPQGPTIEANTRMSLK